MPKSAYISITGRCNLRCSYCLHFGSEADLDTDIPAEEWFKFFEELKNESIESITLSGGEPLFRKDIKEIIEKIARCGIAYSVLTNGTLITDEMASFLRNTGKCKLVQVSIDGSIPISHDAFRGKGNFKKAMDGVSNLQKHDIPVTVRVTIHKKNVSELEDIAKLLLEEIKLPEFSTCSAAYMGLCRENTEDLMLSAEERTQGMQKLLALNNKYGNRITASAGPLAEARNWLRVKSAAQKGEEAFEGGGYLSACGGTLHNIAVRSDGMMNPCCLLPHIELGKINEVKIRDIWFEHPELVRLRNRVNIPLDNFESCKGCEYINYCRGSCPALSYNMMGDDKIPCYLDCYRFFLQDGGRLPKNLSLKTEDPKGVPEWIKMLMEI